MITSFFTLADLQMKQMHEDRLKLEEESRSKQEALLLKEHEKKELADKIRQEEEEKERLVS